MSHRWMKFWPQDWEGDVALRVVSLSAQGLWMRLICAMHRGEPYGHLTMNGQGLTVRQVASLASVTEREAAKLLAELEAAAVLSRTPEGIIFSRRMVRDNERSQEGRDAVSKRWAKKVDTGEDDDEPSTPPNRSPSRTSDSPPRSLEAEAEAETDSETTSRPVEASPSPAALPPPDARTALWTEGLARLRRLTGKPDKAARGLLGRFCRAAHDDCALISGLLHEAEAARVGEPIAWLQAAIQTRTGARQPERKQTALGEWAAMLTPQDDRFDFDGQAEEIRH